MEEEELVVDDSSSASYTEFLVQSEPQDDLSKIFDFIEGIQKINIHGYVLFQEDLFRLMDGHWLNDVIINTYLQLVMQKHTNSYVFSTYTYPLIKKYPYEVSSHWYPDVDVFSYEYIVFPVFTGNHWTLIIANTFLLNYYDSLGKIDIEILNTIRRFLIAVYRVQRGGIKKFIGRPMTDYIPFQENGNDCGVFCCMYARFAVDNKIPELFSAEDIPLLRKRMLHEILAGELIYRYD